ncbi:MAG: tRNA (adenosine(37)-N6)-threonylcarbamoyltransferase complex dimerization subunit type 1 TsaB [Odoribacter sp.]|nr:tRNA (adenosine(37)-N6)-threonylcarbamoyltransferase complex dimerization subunit type 1 TsaB [Odoribacter sp.]
MILCLETATPVCSVALCDRAGIISLRESRENKSHAKQLTLFIEELLKEADLKPAELEAVAVSKGPGSYTGLRIGVSVAKGIAYGASVPLIGIDTTRSMFNGVIGSADDKYGTDITSLYCPMIDAKRMEVYYTIFDAGGSIIKGISAEVISERSFSEVPESVKMVFFGDGAGKCRDVTSHKNSVFDTEFMISAACMHKTVFEKYDSGRFEDVAYFEPFYLKDFITTIQRKNFVV